MRGLLGISSICITSDSIHRQQWNYRRAQNQFAEAREKTSARGSLRDRAGYRFYEFVHRASLGGRIISYGPYKRNGVPMSSYTPRNLPSGAE